MEQRERERTGYRIVIQAGLSKESVENVTSHKADPGMFTIVTGMFESGKWITRTRYIQTAPGYQMLVLE